MYICKDILYYLFPWPLMARHVDRAKWTILVRLKEAVNINLGLLALKSCIKALHPKH